MNKELVLLYQRLRLNLQNYHLLMYHLHHQHLFQLILPHHVLRHVQLLSSS
jgi:hypothetical protein